MALAVCLGGCGAAGDGRYVGTASTTQGACGLGFDNAGKATATLLIQGDQARFVPSDGVTVLPGTLNDKGHITTGITAPGADKKPFPQVFEGDRDGGHVRGVFANPRCRAAVELHRG